ncbi:MAG: phosphatidylserine decarboxylase, partial [Bacteroidota bacterium]
MMIFHKEGFFWRTIAIVDVILLSLLTYFVFPDFLWLGISFGLLIFVLIAQFFRNPVRKIKEYNDHLVYAPADGKIVVIEPVMENEFFKEERIQVSIFMSPLNVHV